LGRHERADGHGWRWVWDDGHGWWRAAAAEQVGSTRYSVYYSVYLLYWYERWDWVAEGSSSRASRVYQVG
jgi:hypothetical protein